MNVLIKYIFIIGFTIVSSFSFAQYDSNKGWFTVDQVRGCEGLVVKILSFNATAPCDCYISGDCPVSCNIDYTNDGATPDEAIDWSMPEFMPYEEEGIYTFRIGWTGADDVITVEVVKKGAPEFEAFTCNGRNVQVNIIDRSYDNYVIDYGDGTVKTVPLGWGSQEHTYTNVTPRTISVRGQDNNSAPNCPVSTTQIVPVNTLTTSTITALTAISEDSVELEYDLQPSAKQKLEISLNGNAYTPLIDLGNEITSQKIPNNLTPISLDLENNFYCFRISTFDPCQGPNVVIGRSNEICSIDLDLTINDGENKLIWNTKTPTSNFTISRSANGSSDQVGNTANTLRMKSETDIDCNVEYCYTISAQFGVGVSRSLEKCGTSFSTELPDPVRNISTQVEGTNMIITWNNETGIKYELLRDSENIANISEATFADMNLNTSETGFCYSVNTTDECNNKNTSGPVVCSMFLTGSIDKTDDISIFWNAYEGWEQGVANYTIEKTYADGSMSTFTSATASFTETDSDNNQQLITYNITANPNEAGVEPSISNSLTLIKPNNIYRPSAFTPNGDGTNESFSVKGRFMVDYNLDIFNKWGELIFTSNNPDIEWNGKFNNKDIPRGAYAFICKIKDQAGREIIEKGTIMLLRK